QFVEYLAVERGLSRNTLEAYERDITIYLDFLVSRGIASLEETAASDVQAFMAAAKKSGAAASTIFRRQVAVRTFYRFLAQENIIPADPTAAMGTPKPGRKLPDALSGEEVERLLAAPDVSKPNG